MSDPKLGELITGGAARDAIHVAVAPVVAKHSLLPGERIGFVYDGNTELVSNEAAPIGVVDPYLRRRVEPGDRFWMFLFPGTITSLRHDWTHSAFGQTSPSYRWLCEFADSAGISYKQLIQGADDWVEDGSYLCFGGLLEGVRVPDEFWPHYETVTRKKVGDDKRQSFFTCSC